MKGTSKFVLNRMMIVLLIVSMIASVSISFAKYTGRTDFNVTVYAPKTGSVKIAQVSGGLYHSLAIDSSGQLYGWGRNDYGRIGNGTVAADIKLPSKLATDVRFQYVNAGENYSLGIDFEGNIYTWGIGFADNHNFGRPSSEYYVPHRMNIPGNPKFKKVCNTRDSSIALDTNGNIWTWGSADSGILGDGSTNRAFRSTPEIVNIFWGTAPKFVDMAVSYGDYPSLLAVDDNGNIWGWGSNRYGELGFGNYNQKNRTPVIVYTASTGLWSATPGIGAMRQLEHLPAGTKMKSVAMGWQIGGSMDENGSIYTWGGNTHLELGTGDTANGSDYPPKQVYNALTGKWTASGSQTFNLEPGQRIVYYHIAYSSGYAIDELGNVYSWGRGASGKLGNGSTSNRAYPSRIYNAEAGLFTAGSSSLPAGTKIIGVAGNRDFVFLQASEGSVFAFGASSAYQLGNGSSSTQNTAVLISSGISGSAFSDTGLLFPDIAID